MLESFAQEKVFEEIVICGLWKLFLKWYLIAEKIHVKKFLRRKKFLKSFLRRKKFLKKWLFAACGNISTVVTICRKISCWKVGVQK